MKKAFAFILCLCVLLSCAACGAAPQSSSTESTSSSASAPAPAPATQSQEQKTEAAAPKQVLHFTFTVASTAAPGTPNYNLRERFCQLVEEKSGGSIIADHLADGSVVSSERECTEAIQLGTIDMATCSDMGIDSVIGGLGWAWLPYMITNYDEVDEYYMNGWINEEMTRVMAERGVIKVGNYENDFRVVANTKKPILTIEDFKGLKIRVPEIAELLRFYELAGALSVAISSTETLTALQQGTIDGVDNTSINLQLLGLISNLNYITPINHMYSGGSIIANPTFWNGLTDEQRAIITEAAKEAGLEQIKQARTESARLLGPEGEAEYGYEVGEVSPELDAALREIAQQVWNEFSANYDAAMIEKVLQTFGNS